MYWIIFDTSTKQDYYRDVHNLLALPCGATIRYDYREAHLSSGALAEFVKDEGACKKVLLVYAQDGNFEKGDPDPVGPLTFENAIWIGTRLANLSFSRKSGDRYYFDLQVLGYPRQDELESILRSLNQDVPFSKWVAVSDRDFDFEPGDPSANWAAIVNQIGVVPSQFAGDSFWRVERLAHGALKHELQPTLQTTSQIVGQRDVKMKVQAIYPVTELDKISILIECRMPDHPAKSGQQAVARTVAFETAAEGPLKALNGKTVVLRRHANEWVESEIAGSDRIDSQSCSINLKTGPTAGAFPIGAELQLQFQAAKNPVRSFFSLLLGIAAAACAVVGAEILKDSFAWGLAIVVLGALGLLVAYFLWTGRVNFPGAK